MNIVQYPHPSLRFQARPVTRIDDALRADLAAALRIEGGATHHHEGALYDAQAL